MARIDTYRKALLGAIQSNDTTKILRIMEGIRTDCEVYLEGKENKSSPGYAFHMLDADSFILFVTKRGFTPTLQMRGATFHLTKECAVDIGGILADVSNVDDDGVQLVVHATAVIMEELLHSFSPKLTEVQITDWVIDYLTGFLEVKIPQEQLEAYRKSVRHLYGEKEEGAASQKA